jgi:DNA-binding FadR family transcriptional regulator
LREHVLRHKDGEFLGSENELVQQLGVSRPTFRQAAKLVEQEQLLVIRRGVGGGFFARQPSTFAVAHVSAVYLLSRKATVEDAIRAARPLFAETARWAALRRHPSFCSRFAAFLAQEEVGGPDATDIKAFLRSEREFLTLFAGASGNPVLELYTTVLLDFAASFVQESVYAGHPDRITVYRGLRSSLIQAILKGDEELAMLLSHRRSDAIIGWMEAGMAKTGGTGQSARRGRQVGRELIRPPGTEEAESLTKQ